MAKLAIRGHARRGKEVIEILKMLGGKNRVMFEGHSDCYLYFINDKKTIVSLDEQEANLSTFNIFTLEEFLDKSPYKVGNEVVTSYNNRPYIADVKAMRWSEDLNEVLYQVGTLHNVKVTDILPTAHVEQSKENEVEETMWVGEMILPNGCEFRDENGNAIHAQKIVMVKKQPQYPKTYKECCDILGLGTLDNDAMGYKHELLIRFQELLIARDAYWKLAGDWRPDWKNDKESYNVIATTKEDIGLMSSLYVDNAILSFPTVEMRDAFYENFKDLIEECKELL